MVVRLFSGSWPTPRSRTFTPRSSCDTGDEPRQVPHCREDSVGAVEARGGRRGGEAKSRHPGGLGRGDAEWAVLDDEGRDLAEVFAEIAVELCDTSLDDPSARRSLDAIGSGMAPLRDRVSHKLVVATSNIAASRGMCEAGGLPDGVDGEEMFAMWRIGFLVRALEVSLPPTWLDPDVTLIVVDSEAAREAAYRWSEEHPDCTQEESDEAMKRVMLDPQFRIDVDDERVGVDPRFLMFELTGTARSFPSQRTTSLSPTDRRWRSWSGNTTLVRTSDRPSGPDFRSGFVP
jgi:hypothetical protein